MRTPMKKLSLLLFLLCFSGMLQAAAKATVDRNVINEGETFRLIIESDDDPDLTPLEALFNVLGTSSSNQVRIINGSMSSTSQLFITLSPKQSGRLIIPALTAGKDKTRAIEITVRKAGSTANAGGRDVFIEAEVSSAKPYVQSQVIYTVRLYHAADIRDGGLSQPAMDDVVIERLGNDKTFRATVKGRDYQVTERKYALFPQASGRITIPSTVFSGQVVDSRGRFSNPGMDPFNRFFSQGTLRPIRLRSNPVVVDVQPRPDGVDGAHWLPAESVKLTESWSHKLSSLTSGEPVTRTIRIEARGLTGAQLPEIRIDEHPAYKQYPDRPLVENLSDNNSLTGIREEKMAIVPNQEGMITLPEIRVPWWNTKKNRLEIASIPSRELTVVASGPFEKLVDKNSTENINNLGGAQVVENAGVSQFWRGVAIFNLVGWLLTAFFLLKRRGPENTQDAAASESLHLRKANLSHAREAVRLACLENNARRVREALLEWAKVAWSQESPSSLHMIAKLSGNSVLEQLLGKLDRSIYSPGSDTWDGHLFWDELSPVLKADDSEEPHPAAGLPQLYPLS